MADDDETWRIMDQARQDMDEMTMREFVQARGVMAPFLALSLAIVSFISGLGETIMRPISAIGRGLADVTSATFGESVQIIAAGARQAAWSLEHGVASMLGPGTYPLAIATVGAGIAVFAWFWAKTEWNPLGYLFDR